MRGAERFMPSAAPPNVQPFAFPPVAAASPGTMPQNAPATPPPTALGGYLNTLWNDSLTFFTQNVLPRIERDYRQREGIYDPEIAQAIRQVGDGADAYLNETDAKCSAGEALILDILSDNGSRPWKLMPTPSPDLPEQDFNEVTEQIVAEYERANGAINPEMLFQFAMDKFDERSRLLDEKAKEAARFQEDKIADQLAEGCWEDAVRAFVEFLLTYPVAGIVGPLIRNEKRLKWAAAGESPKVVTEAVPVWEAWSPWDFYPAANAKKIGQGSCFYTKWWNLNDLAAQRGASGWNSEEIDKILAHPPADTNYDQVESARAPLEGRESYRNQGLAAGTVRGRLFWGRVQGEMLTDWGTPGEYAPDEWYDIFAVSVGPYVPFAEVNGDPLGEWPINKACYRPRANQFYGRSVPELMRDDQKMVSAAGRALQRNMAYTSGPMTAYDVDAMPPNWDPKTQIGPLGVLPYHSNNVKNSSRPPVEFYQADSNASELLAVMQRFTERADDRTGLPRYTYGNTEGSTGAAETASGLSMLLGQAGKQIRAVVSSIDRDILRPVIARQHRWNMLNLPYEQYAIHGGDVRVIPCGAVSEASKEENNIRLQDFLKTTSNPTDMMLLGLESRSRILASIARRLDVPLDDLLTDDKIMERVQMLMMQQMGAPGEEDNENLGNEVTGAGKKALAQKRGSRMQS